METMMSPHSTKDDGEKIQDVLVELGYNLCDKGKYWQCNAIYRNGDNRTALQIWKNTGIWRDFVANTSYQPFKRLIELSCKDDVILNKFLKEIESNEVSFISSIRTPKMEMDQFMDHKEIKTLLPHYSFYNDKKISDETLKLYKSGFSMSGKMNGRFVFPIFDENQKAVGLSGRHLLWNKNSFFPKWKHIGRKANWIYPIFNGDKDDNIFLSKIENKKEIILVEGIGDSLALTEQGVYNHMVIFGLDVSSKQMSFILSQNIDKIIISTNNDLDKTQNVGLLAAIKIYLKLIKFFDISKIQIRLPILKDFGEMLESNISIDKWNNKKINDKKQIECIIKNANNIKIDDKQMSLLENRLEQLNFETDIISQ